MRAGGEKIAFAAFLFGLPFSAIFLKALQSTADKACGRIIAKIIAIFFGGFSKMTVTGRCSLLRGDFVAKNEGYADEMIEGVIDLAALYGKLSNRLIAVCFDVSHTTIGQYRKEHPAFDLAIREVNALLAREYDDYAAASGSPEAANLAERKARHQVSTLRKKYSLGSLSSGEPFKSGKKKDRFTQVKKCRDAGMNQQQAASHLAISVRTVQRYWSVYKVGGKAARQKPGGKVLRQLLKRFESGELSALEAAQLIECEGLPVPAELSARARQELNAPVNQPK